MKDQGFLEEIIIAGFGGQGVLSAGMILAYAGMLEGKNVAWLPSYGPEMRGGTANCNVVLSDDPVGSPVVSQADTLIVMNGPSLDKFENHVRPGGIIIVNSSLIERKVSRKDVTAYYFPLNDAAAELGSAKAANIVLLGAYMALKGFPQKPAVLESFLKVFGEGKKKFLPINEQALLKGQSLVN
ncbi:MAG: 2-oxoacid:acceptor oxidoreductase family protein [Spirochaetales bacterium]|jgi:2-oxoglutarate ferredoxin oxidoreductase subunit gamma|nr:2-oxoacid:acceptor oxidoreductase family protein [Spirochaetales bacterium]